MKRYLQKSIRLGIVRSYGNTRPFTTSSHHLQQPAEHSPNQDQEGPKISTYITKTSSPLYRSQVNQQKGPNTFRRRAAHRRDVSAATSAFGPKPPESADVGVFVDNEPHKFSAVLLRDICECPACLDASTKQKLFSTADIPLDIRARAVAQTNGGTSILWDQDVPGYPRDHTTEITSDVLRSLVRTGFAAVPYAPGSPVLWDAEMFNPVQDIDYEAYMQDDAVLYQALQQLHSHGLLFVSNVPGSERSVSTIGERIGSIKNTFYGYTWDVRSVPEAINVAYTSQDLGFHMDLLYMHQPPHLQLLHCIRSSAKGGASLFADSYRAAQELFQQNPDAFSALAMLEATFHYNHPKSHLYRQQRPVFEMKPLRDGGMSWPSVAKLLKFRERIPDKSWPINIVDFIDNVSWSPPFQGPLSLSDPRRADVPSNSSPLAWLNRKVSDWHAAAREYSALIHRPDGIYERMMRPGECVIFNNRRVLHARRAFEVGDAGTERWLRGAYLDEDPYMSKLQVLQKRFGDAVQAAAVPDASVGGNEAYFEAASNP